MNTLGIFVKQPVPGRVKTRLAATLGEEQAAQAYAAFSSDLITRFRGTGDRRCLCYTPADSEDFFQSLSGEDYELWSQPDVSLGERLGVFFEDSLQGRELQGRELQGRGDRVVVIGSDSPTLPHEIVEQAFDLLGQVDCVLGPATDGGYYLIGQRDTARPIFGDINWSSHSVLNQAVANIERSQATLGLLPPWYDVDTQEDWEFLRGHVRALRLAKSPINLDATSRVLDRDTID